MSFLPASFLADPPRASRLMACACSVVSISPIIYFSLDPDNLLWLSSVQSGRGVPETAGPLRTHCPLIVNIGEKGSSIRKQAI